MGTVDPRVSLSLSWAWTSRRCVTGSQVARTIVKSGVWGGARFVHIAVVNVKSNRIKSVDEMIYKLL